MIPRIILIILARKDERELLPFVYGKGEPYRIFAVKQEHYLDIKLKASQTLIVLNK